MTSISLTNAVTILATMFVLSLVPGPSIFLVVARSMTSNLSQGLFIILGIVFANLIFILLVMFGVGVMMASMDGLFTSIKYAGSLYLMWLGGKLLRARVVKTDIEQVEGASWYTNLTTGFIITLSAPRAILFYVSVLPSFIDVTKAGPLDVLLLMVIATIGVGGVKLPYALLAHKSSLMLQQEKTKRMIYQVAGTVMILTAGVVAFKA